MKSWQAARRFAIVLFNSQAILQVVAKAIIAIIGSLGGGPVEQVGIPLACLLRTSWFVVRGSGNSIMAISAFFIPVGRGASETLSVRRSASGVTSRTSMVIVVIYVRIFEWRDGSRQRTLNKTGLLVRFADQLSLERWREKVV